MQTRKITFYAIILSLPAVIFLTLIGSHNSHDISDSQVLQAFASGPPNYGYVISLDKTEYHPGDIVTIKVKNTWLTNPEALLTIRNAMSGDMNSYQNFDVLYKEEKLLVNGTAEFRYAIPSDNVVSTDKIYRYLVLVSDASDTSQAASERGFFFSKKDASKIVISDVSVDATDARPGGFLKFKAKITDGLGKPLPSSASMYGTIEPPKECWQYASMQDTISPAAKTDQYKDQYLRYGTVFGYIDIAPQLDPGDYNLVITASGGEAFGYGFDTQSVKVHVSGQAQERQVVSVFTGSFTGNDPYFTLYNGNSSAMAIAGKTKLIHFSGTTVINSCEKVLPNQIVTAHLREYDIVNIREMRSFDTIEAKSNENGRFGLEFNLEGLTPGYYEIIMNSTYNGKEYSAGVEIFLHDIKDYQVHAESQDFAVSIDGWFSRIQTIKFDQQEKNITIVADTSDPYKRMIVAVPHGLLDGNFTVFENGKERGDINARLNATHSVFDFSPNDDHAQIEIVGTSAIPEFGSPTAVIAIVAGATGVIAIARSIRSRNNSKL